jgi:hypothetical protein
MDFSFNVEFAKRYGVDEAIMLKSFQFWIRLNKANKTNYHDNRYWTYNSNKSLAEYFPFWTDKQVRRIVESLTDKKILIKGNYNKIAYDKTSWYAFMNQDLYLSDNFHLEEIAIDHKDTTFCPNGQTVKPKKADRFSSKVKPIPVTNQILNTITNSILSENSKEFSPIEINGIEIKEKKNGKVNPFQLISELQKEEEKAKNCEKKEKEERKPNPTYEAFTIFCETFERLSGANYPKDKNGYYLMNPKDAGGMVYLMKNIEKVDRNGNSIEALKVFVTAAWNLNDKWIRANFTPNTLYGQFSKIFTGYQTSSPEMIEKKKNDRIAELLAEKMKQYEND